MSRERVDRSSDDVKTSTTKSSERLTRRKRRFGYDQRWWADVAQPPSEDVGYWATTRRPLPCLAFVLPLLLLYELGVIWLGGEAATSLRTGADLWMRQALSAIGLRDRLLLPLALVLTLLGWQAFDRRGWRFPPQCLLGMGLESLVLAVALIGLSKVVDLMFVHLEQGPLLAASLNGSRRQVALLVGFLGAGVYEEALFRLALIPTLHALLRFLQTPAMLAGTLAVTASSLLFSIAHHAGAPGEAFTLYAFSFRWAAGVYFAWVFLNRGFGVTVGTHAAYDILVGWLDWHF